jgi:hypothetical protein
MAVTGLIALAFVVGQAAAVSVAALVAAYIVYRQMQEQPGAEPIAA